MADPVRGEIWLTDLGFVAKPRPCLILSVVPTEGERSLLTLVPHATQPRHTRFEVEIELRFLRHGVFDAQSLVTVPRPRLIQRLGRLSSENLREVERAVALWLGLSLAPSPTQGAYPAVEADDAATWFGVMLPNRATRRLRRSCCGLAAQRER
jgi:mRNA interferase MazF